MAGDIDRRTAAADRGVRKKMDGEKLVQGKFGGTDLFTRWAALSPKAEDLGLEAEPRAAVQAICGNVSAYVEREAIPRKRPREDLQAFPTNDRALGKVAEQESG